MMEFCYRRRNANSFERFWERRTQTRVVGEMIALSWELSEEMKETSWNGVHQ